MLTFLKYPFKLIFTCPQETPIYVLEMDQNSEQSPPEKAPIPTEEMLDLDKPYKSSPDAARMAHVEHFESEDASRHGDRTGRLLRKIDLHLLPPLAVMYLLNFLDRSNLAQARQGTLEEDLGMEGTDYNLATSIFFVGYLLMQLPSNMLITRVPPSLYLSTTMTLWGVVSTCNAATHSLGDLIAVRFCLGFVEVSIDHSLFANMTREHERESVCSVLSNVIAGAILPWSHLPHELVVYPSRADATNRVVLHRQCLGQHVWRFTRRGYSRKPRRGYGSGRLAVAVHHRESQPRPGPNVRRRDKRLT